MIYLLNTELKNEKSLLFELNSIYGMGYCQSIKICKTLGISKNFKVFELSGEQLSELFTIFETSGQIFSNDLKKLNILTLKKLVSIKTYRGLRRLKKFPVRGQRTHTNAKTVKLAKNNLG